MLELQRLVDRYDVLGHCRGLEWGGLVGVDIIEAAVGDNNEELVMCKEFSTQ